MHYYYACEAVETNTKRGLLRPLIIGKSKKLCLYDVRILAVVLSADST